MLRRSSDFLLSLGFMVAGAALLFFGSITLGATTRPVRSLKLQFPAAGAMAAVTGGELEAATLPPSRPRQPRPRGAAVFDNPLTAAAAVIMDSDTNAILLEREARAPRPLASITKLMSALVLSELPMQWSATTVITEDDADQNSHHLSVGERFTLEELWHAALVGSSNSAINALVRASGLTAEQFAKRMNAKAEALRLPSLRFVEPTGLNSANLGSAFDAARLLQAALAVDKIKETLRIGQYDIHPGAGKSARHVWSTNWLLTNWVPNRFVKDGLAGKTGYISDSGYNFAVQLTDGSGRRLRVVVLGAASNEARFTEARDLAEWAFENYAWPGEEGNNVLEKSVKSETEGVR